VDDGSVAGVSGAWTVDVGWRRPPAAADVPGLLATLPAAERERAEPMAPARRAGFVAGRAVARALLGDRLGVPASDVPLTVVDHRPVLPSQLGWFLSISHSGSVVACAVARRPVGLDVEAPERPPRESLVRRMCTPAEAAEVAAATDSTAAFFRLWVRKEAVSKATGAGLDAGFGDLDVRRSRVTAGDTRWRLRDLTLDGLPAAVAAPGRWWRVRVRLLSR
jgi:phosphopantetheinyl transferase